MKNSCSRIILVAVAVWLGLSAPARAEDVEAGGALFKKYCKRCHTLTEQTLVGPGLSGVTSRRTEDWLSAWIKDPKDMIAKGDPDALGLKKKFNIVMPTLKGVEDDEARKSIVSFLKENDKKMSQ